MMKRFVSIWFPYLLTDWYALHNKAVRDLPFVLKATARNSICITAANILAVQKGIYTGMALADARAIYPALESFDAIQGTSENLLKKIAAWCIRFAPVVAVDGSDGIIIDATGCSHLLGSDHAYVADIINRLKAKGFFAKAAMADTIGAAWAMARFRNKSCIVHSGKHQESIRLLPVQALRLPADTVERLHKLGLHQIKDIMHMPPRTLSRRFGKVIVQRLNEAKGTIEEFIEPVIPVAVYHERLACLGPIVHLAGIEIALQQLIEILCKRLLKDGKGARQLGFSCFAIDGEAQNVMISTTAATSNVKHLLGLFAFKLPCIAPGLGIELFILEASKVEHAVSKQEVLWKSGAALTDASIAELVDRLQSRFEDINIKRYLPAEHHLPERSIQSTSSLQEKASIEWQSNIQRPIILLPQPVQVEVTAPIPDYPPMMFRYNGKLRKIIKADGPERIEQEWWIKDGRHRDYYAVEDEDGGRYWLFRSGHYDAEKSYKWFVHGLFG